MASEGEHTDVDTKMSYVKVTGKVPLRDDVTMATILNDMRGKGVQSEVVFEEDNITLPFETLMDKIDECAKSLLAMRLKRGDTMLVVSCITSEALVLYLASMSIGITHTHPVTYSPRKRVLPELIDEFKPEILVVGEGADSEMMDALLELKEENNKSLEAVSMIMYDDTLKARSIDKPWITRISQMKSTAHKISNDELLAARGLVHGSDIAALFATSGSTGRPKAAQHNHRAIANKVLQSLTRPGMRYLLSCMDIEFISYMVMTDVLFQNGTQVVIAPQETYKEGGEKIVAELINKHKVQSLTMQKGIPSKLINLVKNHGYKFPSLQIVVPTGQKYSPAFKMEIMEQLKSVPLSGYGCTEASFMAHAYTPNLDSPDLEKLKDDRLTLVNHSEGKIIDDEGNVVERGTPGEFCFRSFGVMTGYRNSDSGAPANPFTSDRFYKTGDIGIIHKDGSLEILGRKSDIMRFKVKQNVVFPTKIEEVLATYPGVAEAVVVSAGVNDAYGDEVTYCLRRSKPGEKPDDNDIIDYVVARTNDLGRACRIVYFEEFPWTKNGRKVSKKDVKDQVQSWVAAEKSYGMTEWFKRTISTN